MKKVPNFEFHTDTLKGKNILVTGAGSGIGKQVALDAAKAGAKHVSSFLLHNLSYKKNWHNLWQFFCEF